MQLLPHGHSSIAGNAGGPYKTLDGAVNIHDADPHRAPVNELFHLHTGVNTTLAVAANACDTSITVVDGTLFNNNDEFQLSEGVVIEGTFPTIKSGGGTNTFVLDRQLDQDFAIGATVEVVETNMNVAGSLGAPISFKVIPDPGEDWHSITLTVSMTHNTGSDPSLFGNIAELTNGLAFRIFNGLTGKFRTFTQWKTNYQIGLDFGFIDYQPKVGGGDFGTFASANIKFRSGAVPRIIADNGDYIEGLVQDPLGGLITLKMKLQGHKGRT